MKEVTFRWVDRYLIHLRIREKVPITFSTPLLFIAFLTWSLLADGHDRQMQLRQRIETTAEQECQQGDHEGQLALITHYLVTFVSWALYATNQTPQTISNGAVSTASRCGTSSPSWRAASTSSPIANTR